MNFETRDRTGLPGAVLLVRLGERQQRTEPVPLFQGPHTVRHQDLNQLCPPLLRRLLGGLLRALRKAALLVGVGEGGAEPRTVQGLADQEGQDRRHAECG